MNKLYFEANGITIFAFFELFLQNSLILSIEPG